MLTFGDLLQTPAKITELQGAHALVAAGGTGEILVRQPPRQREPTMVFKHETIQMMMAERAGEIEKLRTLIGPDSVILPLVKKPDSFWDYITLGRSPSADLVVNDPAVSGVHAHFPLGIENQPVSIQDVGSSNGTFLNRKPIQPHAPVALSTGDCLRFGQSVFYFVDREALAKLVGAA